MTWISTREPIEDRSDPARLTDTAVVRSDDGALLVSCGANRERATFFEYRRGDLRIRLSGSQFDGSDTEASELFVVYLTHDLDMLRIRTPERTMPSEAEIDRLKRDVSEAVPSWGWVLANQIPIKGVVFK